MKKLILAALVILAATAATYAGPVITIRIEIGKKSEGCSRFGICKTTIEGSWAYSSMQHDEERNTLLINLDKEITAGKEEYFYGQTVTFEEAYTLPSDIQRALGFSETVTIEPGAYQLLRTSKGYQIMIPLK
jgi:hypothetical protein